MIAQFGAEDGVGGGLAAPFLPHHRTYSSNPPVSSTGYTDWVYSVAFSQDGKTLASGSTDDTNILWDVAAQRQLGQPLH